MQVLALSAGKLDGFVLQELPELAEAVEWTGGVKGHGEWRGKGVGLVVIPQQP